MTDPLRDKLKRDKQIFDIMCKFLREHPPEVSQNLEPALIAIIKAKDTDPNGELWQSYFVELWRSQVLKGELTI